MFFSITREPDPRFPHSQQIEHLYFNCDNGWQNHTVACTEILYKGYTDNFCRVLFANGKGLIQHNRFRTFPLWFDQNHVTNLPGSDLKQAWADDQVLIDHEQVRSEKLQLDLSVPEQILSTQQAMQHIIGILDGKILELKKTIKSPIKLFCSGGLDTTLLYAMLNFHQVPYQLLLNSHYESDEFTSTNQQGLKQLWAYQQIHHWISPTWLATGSCGDEYFLRGPSVIAMITAWHGIDFVSLLEKHTTCYHYPYFQKKPTLWQETWPVRQQLKRDYPDVADLHRQVLNMLSNDHQHWHLGNTLTWTPFNDLEIARTLLQCDVRDLLDQFLDGAISKRLIAHYDPSALNLVSQFKNQNPQENIKKLLENQ